MALLLMVGACRDGKLVVELDRCWPSTRCSQPPPDAGPGPLEWGVYAATLPVPACPDAPTLVVSTIEDQLDTGSTISDPAAAGAELSLAEALWIAFNRSGPDTILFDAEIFKVDAPATIFMPQRRPLPQDLIETCIDARARGVIVDWGQPDESTMVRADAIWGVGAGSLEVGLVFLHPPYGQTVQGQMAGCRFATDGLVAARGSPFVITATGTLGPGNVVLQGAMINAGVMRDNFVNYDPLTGIQFGGDAMVQVVDGASLIQANVFSGVFVSLFRSGQVTFRHNWVGVTPSGISLRTAPGGVAISGYGTEPRATIGPANTITGGATGVSSNIDGPVRITKNLIFGNEIGIWSTLAAPAITTIESGMVRGTCPRDGHIEVFGDRGNQGEFFLGETDCTNGAWSLTFAAPMLPFVTATLTDTQGHTSSFSEPFSLP